MDVPLSRSIPEHRPRRDTRSKRQEPTWLRHQELGIDFAGSASPVSFPRAWEVTEWRSLFNDSLGQFGEHLVVALVGVGGSAGADLGGLLFTIPPRRYSKHIEAVEVGWLGSAAATIPA